MSMFGAPFGIFIAMLVMDKFRVKQWVGLLILIAVLGYIYSLQTSMLLITLIGFFLITFVYMYVAMPRQCMSLNLADRGQITWLRSGECSRANQWYCRTLCRCSAAQ